MGERSEEQRLLLLYIPACANAHLIFGLPYSEPFSARGNNKAGDSTVSLRRIGIGHDEKNTCMFRIGDPQLGTVDGIVIIGFLCRSFQGKRIRTRTRLFCVGKGKGRQGEREGTTLTNFPHSKKNANDAEVGTVNARRDMAKLLIPASELESEELLGKGSFGEVHKSKYR